MSPTGKRRHSASAAAVLPAAVGPIRNTAGGSCPPGLLATQKKAVQSLHVKLYPGGPAVIALVGAFGALHVAQQGVHFIDRKSTRLNSSHVAISYAVFCLKKKN